MFYLHHLFRSFLPLHNPIGFSAADFIEFAAAVAMILAAAAWTRWQAWFRWLAPRTALCMAILAILPAALRLCLLHNHPIPTPEVADDFSYVLLGDTLAHFRLANPPHPLPQFFETLFVLQEPSYSSIYPLGQGMALALGKLIFGNPWAGVALSIGFLCALCYWMLRAFTTPEWALAGGALAVIQFGPLNQWMNSFWGGAIAGIAGCMVFGGVARLRKGPRLAPAVIAGLGGGLHLLTRPYETIFLALGVALFLLMFARASLRAAPVMVLCALPAAGLTLLHNREVTGQWTTLPYSLSRQQYGVPAGLTLQSNPRPERPLTPAQRLDYEVQSAAHGDRPESISAFFSRLASRVRFYRFFFLPPLYFALAAFLFTLRDRRQLWILLTVAIFAAGANFYPFFYSHYIAALTGLFLLMSIIGLQRIGRIVLRGFPVGAQATRWLFLLCVAHFAFWFTVHAIGDPSMWRYETWDAINYGDPTGRALIRRELAAVPGTKLVFVRYGPLHTFAEWVYNDAAIDASPVVWARDLGPTENRKLLAYYPNRRAFLLEPDARPLQLVPYSTSTAAPQQPVGLKFEEVH